MRTVSGPHPERYYGVDIAEDGTLVVAERPGGHRAPAARYPAGSAGALALRNHIAGETVHSHVCIRSDGSAALALASALIPLPGSEVTIVASHAIASRGFESVPPNAEERARRLAELAERLF
jgi:hypothetical protein